MGSDITHREVAQKAQDGQKDEPFCFSLKQLVFLTARPGPRDSGQAGASVQQATVARSCCCGGDGGVGGETVLKRRWASAQRDRCGCRGAPRHSTHRRQEAALNGRRRMEGVRERTTSDKDRERYPAMWTAARREARRRGGRRVRSGVSPWKTRPSDRFSLGLAGFVDERIAGGYRHRIAWRSRPVPFARASERHCYTTLDSRLDCDCLDKDIVL